MRRKADFVVSWELYTEEVRNAKIDEVAEKSPQQQLKVTQQ
jgi:hypothetical protein